MTVQQLFQAGQLSEAVRALSAEVRDNPTDVRRRTFLFELLCFAGEYERADKHLNILSEGNKQTELGALLYRSALFAERARHDIFAKQEFPTASANPSAGGTINGQRFESFEDADPRIGARLEVFAAGTYIWIPFEHVESIETEAPKKLRDLLWIPAIVRTNENFKAQELGEVLIPVLYPFSSKAEDETVRLGRVTIWQESADGVIPLGQKMFLADDEEYPLLEIRKIEFDVKEGEEEVAAEESA